jgi:ankyrin repeat protein
MSVDYYQKYLKYKSKYFSLQEQIAGGVKSDETEELYNLINKHDPTSDDYNLLDRIKEKINENKTLVNSTHKFKEYRKEYRKEYVYTPLSVAIINNKRDIIDLLLNHPKIDVNVYVNVDVKYKYIDGTVLHIAIRTNDIEIVNLLLSHKNTKDKINVNKNTPLHYAIANKKTEIIKVLLKHPKINVKLKNSYNDTPLHLAVEYGLTDIVKLLIEKGAKINETNRENFTPLHIAVTPTRNETNQQINKEITEILLNNKDIKVNIIDLYGDTPLHKVLKTKKIYLYNKISQYIYDKININILKLLLFKLNIDVSLTQKDRKKNTPIDYFRAIIINKLNISDELIQLLKEIETTTEPIDKKVKERIIEFNKDMNL